MKTPYVQLCELRDDVDPEKDTLILLKASNILSIREAEGVPGGTLVTVNHAEFLVRGTPKYVESRIIKCLNDNYKPPKTPEPSDDLELLRKGSKNERAD